MTQACHKLDSSRRLCLLSSAFNLIFIFMLLYNSNAAVQVRAATEGGSNNNASLWLRLSQYRLPPGRALSDLLKIQTFALDTRVAFVEVLIKHWSMFLCVSFFVLAEQEMSWPAQCTADWKTQRGRVFKWLANICLIHQKNTIFDSMVLW